MKTLQEIWTDLAEEGYRTDKGDVHSYLPVYEEILKPYRFTNGNILEIGLFKGDSFRMWERYYCLGTRHYGIDCDLKPHGGMADLRPLIEEGRGRVFIMDATDPIKVWQEFEGIKFEVIIEDAGHDISQQLVMYSIFKNLLVKGGIYIIEDIQDIDATRAIFENIDPEKKVEILDRRNEKGRYDDVLVIIRDK